MLGMCIDLENDGFHLCSSPSHIHSHPLHFPFIISSLFAKQYGEYNPSTDENIWNLVSNQPCSIFFFYLWREKKKKYVKIHVVLYSKQNKKFAFHNSDKDFAAYSSWTILWFAYILMWCASFGFVGPIQMRSLYIISSHFQ